MKFVQVKPLPKRMRCFQVFFINNFLNAAILLKKEISGIDYASV